MELELDLKISKTIDELHSTDFRIAKDRAGPIFLTQENNNMFFLIAHLKGYKNDNIKIDINEDGTLIAISGNKAVQETVMKGWVMHKEEPQMKGFMKVYKIPRGVVLDKIKADYNDDDSTLTIYMPKHKKGIIGGEIEEVKGEKQVGEGSLQEKQASGNDKDLFDQEEEETMHESKGVNEIQEVVSKLKGKIHDEEAMPFVKRMEKDEGEASSIRDGNGKDFNVIRNEGGKEEDEIIEERRLESGCEPKDVTQASETKQGDEKDENSLDQHELEESNNDNRCKLFAPCLFIGSTLIASLVALFFKLVKSKRH